MKKTKKLAALLLALVLTLSFTACGGGGNDDTEGDAGETQTLVVGATPSPHGEMLEFVK